MNDPEIKVIKDEPHIQEGEITLSVDNIDEVKNALVVVRKLRKMALEAFDVDEEPEDDDDIVVTSVELRVDGDKVIAHVTQGLV